MRLTWVRLGASRLDYGLAVAIAGGVTRTNQVGSTVNVRDLLDGTPIRQLRVDDFTRWKKSFSGSAPRITIGSLPAYLSKNQVLATPRTGVDRLHFLQWLLTLVNRRIPISPPPCARHGGS